MCYENQPERATNQGQESLIFIQAYVFGINRKGSPRQTNIGSIVTYYVHCLLSLVS